MRDINAGVVEINKSTVFVQPALKKLVVGDPERELTVRQIITAEIDAPPLQINGRILLVQVEDVVVSAIHIGIAACPYRIQRHVPHGDQLIRFQFLQGQTQGFIGDSPNVFFHFVKADDSKFHQCVEDCHLVFSVNQRQRITESGRTETFVGNTSLAHLLRSP